MARGAKINPTGRDRVNDTDWLSNPNSSYANTITSKNDIKQFGQFGGKVGNYNRNPSQIFILTPVGYGSWNLVF